MEPITVPNRDVVEIARQAIQKTLPKAKIERVEVNREGLTIPADLGIAVIFSGRGSVRLTGKQIVSIHTLVSAELARKGDERFPHIRFLTTQEAKSVVS